MRTSRSAEKASLGNRAKPFLFLTLLRANWFPPKSSAKRGSSLKQIWLKLSRVRRIASRQSARISADAAAARISISITNISLRSNGDRRQYAYRNRITVHAQDGVIGFFRRDSHRLLGIERCPISRDEVNHALAELRAQEYVRDGHYTLRAASEPRVFSQVNDEVAQALRDLIIDLVPPNQDLLIDAYCGAGFFAKALLDKFLRVIGIDWDRFAIVAAKQNATEKETYIAGDVESELQKVGAVHLNGPARGNDTSTGRSRSMAPTTIIIDPPATGLTEGVRKAISDLAPETLIYVSCNPPTLARDLKELQHRFAINSITPLDMFPQTAEIEVVVHLHA